MAETNDTEIEKWGELKLVMETEGDGYFFYGYGLPSEFMDDDETEKLFNEAEKAIDRFKTFVEQKIIDNGGDPEDWSA